MKILAVFIASCCLMLQSNKSLVILDYVSDGDTFYVHSLDNKKLILRLAEVDCPEKDQAYGMEAKEFIKSVAKRKDTLAIQILSKDRYGRMIASISFKNRDFAELLISNGYAWHYKQYSDNEKLSNLEKEARNAHRGLWTNENALPPWEFRRHQNK
jgi:endonuclease YncB( thermonuclease family)